MTIIQYLRDLLHTCPVLQDALVTVDHLDGEYDRFSVDPLPGARLVETDIAGGKTWEYPFSVSGWQCTAEEQDRLQANGLFEQLADWMEDMTDHFRLPAMPEGKEVESLSCTSWGYLLQKEDDPSSAIYQISCVLVYRT